MPDLPTKPRHGAPCNGCGLCCAMEVCGVGKLAYPGASAPCPGMRFDGQRIRCAVVEMEAMLPIDPVFTRALGIGRGCDAEDGDA